MIRFEENKSEDYYKKVLLLDKVKPFLGVYDKQYIFNKEYCWDILFNDVDIPMLCYNYSCMVLHNKSFPEGEKYIAKNTSYSFYYSLVVINKPFPLGEEAIAKDAYYSYIYSSFVLNKRFYAAEETILNSRWADSYIQYFNLNSPVKRFFISFINFLTSLIRR